MPFYRYLKKGQTVYLKKGCLFANFSKKCPSVVIKFAFSCSFCGRISIILKKMLHFCKKSCLFAIFPKDAQILLQQFAFSCSFCGKSCILAIILKKMLHFYNKSCFSRVCFENVIIFARIVIKFCILFVHSTEK